MKKVKSEMTDELRLEYKRSDFGKIVRGKYAHSIKNETNIVLLEPDIAEAFPNNGTVNKTLRYTGKLTEDHTPPKGPIKITQVESFHIISCLNNVNGKPIEKGRYSQNGVKYRTICGTCNNNWLGTKYDPAFNLFV